MLNQVLYNTFVYHNNYSNRLPNGNKINLEPLASKKCSVAASPVFRLISAPELFEALLHSV
jgi:hypothetical protein